MRRDPPHATFFLLSLRTFGGGAARVFINNLAPFLYFCPQRKNKPKKKHTAVLMMEPRHWMDSGALHRCVVRKLRPAVSTVLLGVVLFQTIVCTATHVQDVHLLVELRALQRDPTDQRVLQWSANILESRLLDDAPPERADPPASALHHDDMVARYFNNGSGVHPHHTKGDGPVSLGIFRDGATETQLVHVVAIEPSWLMDGTFFDGVEDGAQRGTHRSGRIRGGRAAPDNRTVRSVVLRSLDMRGGGSDGTSATPPRLVAVVNHPSSSAVGGPQQPRHRASEFHTLAYAASTTVVMQQRGIVLTTLQRVSRTATRTITFLASGYTSNQRTLFNTDVAKCAAALRGEDLTLDASPWPRYFPLLNIYSLFEPSLQSGATRQAGPKHDCSTMGSCGPFTRSTNLGCFFGTPDPSRLGCNAASVRSLASFAPAVDIVVVLVNDADVGASAQPLIAVVSTASTYLSYQLVHQLNHAVAGLGDEYSYGFSEPHPSSITLPVNCAVESNAALVDWSYWASLGSVASSPVRGCTFNNLFRPTEESCLMKTATASSMCSVCKEKLLQQLYTGSGVMSIDEPRCPPANWNIYLNTSDTVSLTINHAFVVQNSDVSVMWMMHDGTNITTSVPSVSVSGSTLQAGVNTIRAIITDSSTFVRPSRRPSGMDKMTTFTLRRWQASAGCVMDTCTSSSNVNYTYCRVCSPGSDCTDTLVVPVTYASPSRRSIEQERYVVNITAIVVAGVGGLILIVAFIVYVFYKSKKPNLVYDPSTGEKALSTAVLVTAVLSLVLIVIMVIFAVYYLPQAAVFGQGLFIGVIVLATFVYLVAILKLVAAIFSSAPLAAVCGVVLCFFGIGLFGIGVFGVYVYHNQDTQDLLDTFASLWMDYTTSHPSLICDIQSAFECSGFYHSCTPVSSSYCPSNCAQPNRDYVNACRAPWMDWVIGNSLRVGILCLVCGFFFAVAAVIDCLHCVRTMRAKANARGRRSYRKDERAPVVPITTKEIAQFRAEFAKADAANKGTIEGQELLDFLTEAFGDAPSPQDEQLLLSAGPLSCEELLRMYFPHYVLSQIDPRQLTPEEAEEASDAIELQRLQYGKLDMFMSAAGSLSPEALHRIYQTYAKTHFSTTGREVLELIRSEALRHASTEEAAMCLGLSRQELEGLRGAWISIHPTVVGDLDDDELDKLFQWTHGTVLHSHEHFVRWKDMLDVRRTDSIGWGEFCYPFAQRARLAKAREYLFSVNREVPHEMLSKAQVAEEFGPQLVDQSFMVFEEIIPVERVVEQALKLQDGTAR